MNINEVTKEALQDALDKSHTWKEVRNVITNSNTMSGTALKYLKRKAGEYECDMIQFYKNVDIYKIAKLKKFVHPMISTPYDKIFVENSQISNSIMRRRYLKEVEYRCTKCRISEWQSEKLTLQVDHINGINNDNRMENLRLLCPNCHSQTSTWGNKQGTKKPKNKCVDCNTVIGKASTKCRSCSAKTQVSRYRKVTDRPSKSHLQSLLESNSYVAVGKMYGVSDNTIRKWLKYHTTKE